MKSVGQMLGMCDGLRDTKDISEWENKFLTNMLARYLLANKNTSSFSDKQVEQIDRIYHKHFS
jgi:hypothetical protein